MDESMSDYLAGRGPHPKVKGGILPLVKGAIEKGPSGWPDSFRFRGVVYFKGSRTGSAFSDGAETREYHGPNGERLWLTQDGRILDWS